MIEQRELDRRASEPDSDGFILVRYRVWFYLVLPVCQKFVMTMFKIVIGCVKIFCNVSTCMYTVIKGWG